MIWLAWNYRNSMCQATEWDVTESIVRRGTRKRLEVPDERSKRFEKNQYATV